MITAFFIGRCSPIADLADVDVRLSGIFTSAASFPKGWDLAHTDEDRDLESQTSGSWGKSNYVFPEYIALEVRSFSGFHETR